MAALCARGRIGANRLYRLVAPLLLIAALSPAAAEPLPPLPETIVVYFDQARLMQLPDRAANVVVGNPLIADISIQPGGLTVITGKSFGDTNLVVTDKKGAVLTEKIIEVTGPNERTVVVYRGGERETYSCTPECSRRVMLGDASDPFNKILTDVTTFNTQATAAGAMSSGR